MLGRERCSLCPEAGSIHACRALDKHIVHSHAAEQLQHMSSRLVCALLTLLTQLSYQECLNREGAISARMQGLPRRGEHGAWKLQLEPNGSSREGSAHRHDG